ncbi:MAG: cupin domain-containing protein, partial [Myxococcota bacterium]
REGAESGHTTSVVRYAPGCSFPTHVHSGGEEFLVLDGVFSDESGDFPKGTYVRNPIGSSHAPRSDPGCTIFVKLCQMNRSETEQTVRSVNAGAKEQLLYEDAHERVRACSFEPGEQLELEGAELFVISGEVVSDGERFPSESWIRIPRGTSEHLVFKGPTQLWIKDRHLP